MKEHIILEIIKLLFEQISEIFSKSIPIITLYLGWRLGNYSERRNRALENIDKKFKSLVI